MSIPDWYELALLSLAAFRIWWLVSEDDLLDRPRRYVTRLGKSWQKDGDSLPIDYRFSVAAFIACPWCLGFWVSLAWWGLWQGWPHGTDVAASVFAISTLVGAIASVMSES